MDRTLSFFILKSSVLGNISLFFAPVHQRARKAETISATTVVVAEHMMPKPKRPRKIRSKTALRMEEKARNKRGVLLSPTLFSPAESALNTKTKGTPRKVMERYQVVLSRIDKGVSMRMSI